MFLSQKITLAHFACLCFGLLNMSLWVPLLYYYFRKGNKAEDFSGNWQNTPNKFEETHGYHKMTVTVSSTFQDLEFDGPL